MLLQHRVLRPKLPLHPALMMMAAPILPRLLFRQKKSLRQKAVAQVPLNLVFSMNLRMRARYEPKTSLSTRSRIPQWAAQIICHPKLKMTAYHYRSGNFNLHSPHSQSSQSAPGSAYVELAANSHRSLPSRHPNPPTLSS